MLKICNVGETFVWNNGAKSLALLVTKYLNKIFDGAFRREHCSLVENKHRFAVGVGTHGVWCVGLFVQTTKGNDAIICFRVRVRATHRAVVRAIFRAIRVEQKNMTVFFARQKNIMVAVKIKAHDNRALSTQGIDDGRTFADVYGIVGKIILPTPSSQFDKNIIAMRDVPRLPNVPPFS